MSEEEKTVAGAYAKISSHEELCAERYDNIREDFADVKSWLRSLTFLSVTVLLSLLGFLGAQLLSKIH